LLGLSGPGILLSMIRSTAPELTTPDLVVLSLLAESPMHGYELNQELERREVRDWAGISRPQVYYSLRKLEKAAYISPLATEQSTAKGPDRRVYGPTPEGERALADSLAREDWAIQRTLPPFLTWLALSSHARPGELRRQVGRRRRFLEHELAKERSTLQGIRQDSGPMVGAAELMVELTIRQFEAELEWLEAVERRLI